MARNLLLTCALTACGTAKPASTLPRRAEMPSSVRIARSVSEYPIATATFAGALQFALANGPVTAGGRFPGATEWQVQWRYQYARRAGDCALRDVRAEVTAKVTVPRWEPTAALDSITREAWRNYRDRLDAHEEGHVNNGLDAAAEIVAALRDLTGIDCETLGTRANLVANGLLVRARAKDAEYDRVTRHGALPVNATDARR